MPIETPEQQAAGMILRTRELLIRQRSQTANAFRSQMSEFGIVAAAGMVSVAKLAIVLRDQQRTDIPDAARQALREMVEHIEALTERIERLDRDILANVKSDEIAKRVKSIPGVGALIAATVRATFQDPGAFRSGRDFAAWIGLTPRVRSSGGKGHHSGLPDRCQRTDQGQLLAARLDASFNARLYG